MEGIEPFVKEVLCEESQSCAIYDAYHVDLYS